MLSISIFYQVTIETVLHTKYKIQSIKNVNIQSIVDRQKKKKNISECNSRLKDLTPACIIIITIIYYNNIFIYILNNTVVILNSDL